MDCQIASYSLAIRVDITNQIESIYIESYTSNLWLCTVFCPVRNDHMKYQRNFSTNIKHSAPYDTVNITTLLYQQRETFL